MNNNNKPPSTGVIGFSELDNVKEQKMSRLQSTTIDMNLESEEFRLQQHNVINNNSININIEEEEESDVLRNNHNGEITTESSRSSSSQRHSLINEDQPELHPPTLANDRNNEFGHVPPHRLLQNNNDVTFNTAAAAPHSNNRTQRIHSWRMNLNNVLSFSPSTEALRSLLNHSGNLRYIPLNNSTNNSGNVTTQSNLDVQPQESSDTSLSTPSLMNFRVNINMGGRLPTVVRQNLLQMETGNVGLMSNNNSSDTSVNLSNRTNHQYGNSTEENSTTSGVRNGTADNLSVVNNNGNTGSDNSGYNDVNAEIPELVLNVVSTFVRYLPFICILIIKFIHDHSLNIVDLVILQCTMYKVNNSLRRQIAKLSQKSYGALVRDLGVVICVLAYRFILASSEPDPFGLLITPHTDSVSLEVILDKNADNTASTNLSSGNKVTVTKPITLDVLLYYVAVNDLILKLLTQLIKILITMLPTQILRHKPRARLYVLIESCSQFYRALVPMRQWLLFLRGSYMGLELIAGIVFSSLYIGAKIFELVERSKPVKRSLQCFLHPNNYERKPTNDELNAAGAVCPICHDSYNSPIILQCGHIFCDDCVSTWFKREQTCPMCRTKVSEDPTYQDGSTTFFYQLV